MVSTCFTKVVQLSKAHGCDLSTREDKERGWQIQCQPDLHRESEASLGYIAKLCHKQISKMVVAVIHHYCV